MLTSSMNADNVSRVNSRRTIHRRESTVAQALMGTLLVSMLLPSAAVGDDTTTPTTVEYRMNTTSIFLVGVVLLVLIVVCCTYCYCAMTSVGRELRSIAESITVGHERRQDTESQMRWVEMTTV